MEKEAVLLEERKHELRAKGKFPVRRLSHTHLLIKALACSEMIFLVKQGCSFIAGNASFEQDRLMKIK